MQRSIANATQGNWQAEHDQRNELVDQLVKNESVFTDKIYVTGDSVGGIGSCDLMINYNTKSPAIEPLFAASLILAGAPDVWGYPNPNAAVVTALKDVPLWAIHGDSDDHVPKEWDQNRYAAEQSAGGIMKLAVRIARGA